MTRKDIARVVAVAAFGALIGVTATLVFGLRVHIGLATMTGEARILCAAIGGAVTAFVLDHAIRQVIRQVWPI